MSGDKARVPSTYDLRDMSDIVAERHSPWWTALRVPRDRGHRLERHLPGVGGDPHDVGRHRMADPHRAVPDLDVLRAEDRDVECGLGRSVGFGRAAALSPSMGALAPYRGTSPALRSDR
jgi:hypothetical protein